MKKRFCVWIAAAVLTMMAGGCGNVNSTTKNSVMSDAAFKPVPLVNDVFTVEGIPQKKYMVGGGVIVTFRAPVEGNLYWVEETQKKIIMTMQLDADELFDETLPGDDEDFQRLCGDISKARFTLYFVPTPPAND